MSKKDNFNQAMFEMFGVGKGAERNKAAQQAQQVEQAAPVSAAAGAEVSAAAAPVQETVSETAESGNPRDNIVEFTSGNGTQLKMITPPTTYLAPGTRFEGILRSEGSVEVDGEFKGDILAEGSVTIRTDMLGNITAKSLNVEGCCLTGDARVSELMTLQEGSSVKGNVNAGTLSSSGSIVGDLDVRHNMALDHQAKVVGNISTGTMTIAKGAMIRGTVETRGNDE